MTSPPPRFEVETISIGSYLHHDPIDTDAEAARVVELFKQLGAEHVQRSSEPEVLDTNVVNSWLADWADGVGVNKLIFWVGHGEETFEGAWLAVHETRKPMQGTGISSTTMAEHIHNQWRRRANDESWVVVVIEACGAKRFVSLLNSELSKLVNPAERLLLFSAGGHGQSFLGGFSAALDKALRSFTDNDEFIRLYDLCQLICDYDQNADFTLVHLRPDPKFRRKPLLSSAVTATMDVYEEMQKVLQGLSADERSHFFPKAQGAEQGELACYFTGRSAERQAVFDWLRKSEKTTQGMMVVTGRAGSGKSALLGHVLVYSMPSLRQLLVRLGHIEELSASSCPPDDVFSAVIHLTGLTTAELVRRLLAAVHLRPAGDGLNAWLAQLVDHLRDRPEPFVLMADALDESQEPLSIAASVLRRLAGLPGCRVLVGTRRSTTEGPDQPDTDDDNLLKALAVGEGTQILEVVHDSEAIGHYVRQRLEAALKASALPADLNIDKVLGLIQREPGRQFLYARLAVHELLARPELAEPGKHADLEALLAGDHRQLFAHAVDRLTALNPKNAALLEALALAMGRGLPRAGRVWSIVAQALTDPPALTDSPGTPVNEQDIDDILQSAAPYIMLDAEDGQSVYRLAHRTFQEHFAQAADHVLNQAQRPLKSRHQQIASSLMAAVDPRSQSDLNPYLRQHLAGHVALSGVWAALATRLDLLDQLDPDSLAEAVLSHAFGRSGLTLPPEVAAMVSVRHLLGPLNPQERRVSREIAMARLRGQIDGAANVSLPPGNPPSVAWAKLQPSPLHVVLSGHADSVTSLVALNLPDGRCLLASGSNDQTIRLWDPGRAQVVCTWVVGFDVHALCPLGGLLIVAGEPGLLAFNLSSAVPQVPGPEVCPPQRLGRQDGSDDVACQSHS